MKLALKIRRWLTVILAVALLTLGGSCSYSVQAADTRYPREAFAYFKIDADVVLAYACKKADDTSECVVMAVPTLHTRASGIVVANSVKYSNRQYVMTAGHVCESDKWFEKNIKTWAAEDDIIIMNLFYEPKMIIANSSGKLFNAKVVALWHDRDLCIVAVEHTGVKPIKLASYQVKQGAPVWNLAAPLGIWQPSLQNKFHGSYSGEYTCVKGEEKSFEIPCEPGEPTWSVFALPATQGSSGSPIFNRHGRIIGIISMVPYNFPELAYAVRLKDMHRLLDALLKYELENKKSFEEIDFNTDGMSVDDIVLIED